MEIVTGSIETIVIQIGDPWYPWRWGGVTGWEPGDYGHPVEDVGKPDSIQSSIQISDK